jgi:hypothetical protein
MRADMSPTKLVKSLPKSVRVGPYDIALEPMTPARQHTEDATGYFAYAETKIAFEAHPVSGPYAADTLIHEISHAIYYVYGIKSEDDEERTVSTLSTGLVQVFRDNPWLLGWLKKALK